MTFLVSVVVPTFKRPDLLHRCLDALLAQDFDPTSYEIIIVDDAASAETRQQVECLAECVKPFGYTLRYLPMTDRRSTHGPAAARNLGWRAAGGGIIAFTDDDCVPTPGWLKAGTRALTFGVASASGCVIVPLEHIPTDYENNAAGLEECPFVTANCFCRRDALVMAGGFDERFTAAWREDSDLSFALLEQQVTRVHVPEAIVIHPVRPAPWGISIKQQRKSMFNALLYKKHPALYRQKIQATPPWHYYRIVGALLVVVIGALRRSPLLISGSLCVWIGMTGRFCVQRLHGTSHAPGHVAEMIVTSALIPPLAIFWRIRGAIKFRVLFL